MSNSPLIPQPNSNDAQEAVLTPLTQATIQRAKEGVAYARDRHANEIIRQALQEAEAIAEGGSEHKVSGQMRRKVIRSLIHSLFWVKVEFSERIPTQPVLIAANHLNHIDPFLLLSELPAHPYTYIFGDARTLYNQWWKRQFLHLAKGVIPIERIWKEELAVIQAAKTGDEDLAELADAIEKYVPTGNSIELMRRLDRIVQGIFARGESIILFPEGRLGNAEAQLFVPLKRGVAIYALRSGVPILPVVLVGTQDLYLCKQLTVRFGKLIISSQSSRPKAQEIQVIVDQLEVALMDLLPKDYQEPKEPKLLHHFLNHMFW
ncbi:MAG: 1-acyl-sn-glycerol-3-phosphate acyltransferase [Pelatocladus maniniholoensis HA4357-MV3]|jgi:1-acyl-sn-glycerol-3-phosphate acyltransferase|uniref:1-acyl-sn-glycerol-3-phosphate acyltransferase n=1 Tax=Pelatocladus maniniholoensis HA4357-MV3 TaxID=1117104 RepID=A0A9E3H6Y6_9NOST|nr:1-acyl-sn-glycerol-3-phosphate acyltransferase [Pelatocladus maniniholoensis HA4357-MV3]